MRGKQIYDSNYNYLIKPHEGLNGYTPAHFANIYLELGNEKWEKLLIQSIKYQLCHNYPNPFNSNTMIPYHLPENAPVTISIFKNSDRGLLRWKPRIFSKTSGNQFAKRG